MQARTTPTPEICPVDPTSCRSQHHSFQRGDSRAGRSARLLAHVHGIRSKIILVWLAPAVTTWRSKNLYMYRETATEEMSRFRHPDRKAVSSVARPRERQSCVCRVEQRGDSVSMGVTCLVHLVPQSHACEPWTSILHLPCHRSVPAGMNSGLQRTSNTACNFSVFTIRIVSGAL